MAQFTTSEKEKFEKIKKLVLGVVDRLDNAKQLNIKRFTDLFDFFEQNPDEFRKWEVLNDDSLDSTIQLFMLPFEEPKMEQIKDAADFLKVPLEEYIYYRQEDPEGIRSKMRVPTGYINIKRVQQILSKKNHYSFDVDERSLKTGDVKGDSKAASVSDVESFALTAIGADNALQEFLGPRSTRMKAKNQMYKQIAQNGFCTLESLEKEPSSSVVLSTINTYLLASGIRSDLITPTLQTQYTLDKDIKEN